MELSRGSLLVKLARRAIETYLSSGKKIGWPREPWLEEKRGVFTTLRTFPEKELRGCIGFPLPTLPLGEALIESAISAATQDPRFKPVSLDEMERITVEVTVLTVPKPLPLEKRPKGVIIGKHGLLIRYGMFSGLLLPQVPEEMGWDDPETFLDGTCAKAGLPPGCWKRPEVDVFTFEGEIFEEVRPRGEVVKHAHEG